MKKAIIIGATSGIGRSLAELLASRGYLVGITGRRVEMLNELKEANPNSYLVSSFDCRHDNNSERLQELCVRMGGMDLLVMSAGSGELNEELNFKTEHATNRLNVIAFTEIVNWAINYFKNQRSGHLVAISSIAGLRGSGIAPAYNASKAFQINYLEGLNQAMHKSKLPIYITDIRPGFVDTAMAKGDGQFWVATKEKAARQILKIIDRRQKVGYVTKRWKIIALVLKTIPRTFYL